MPFSVVVDGKVEDIVFRKYTGKGTYRVFLGDRLIGVLYKLATGWAIVVVGDTEYIRSVKGFRTRYDGVEYALRALCIGSYDGDKP